MPAERHEADRSSCRAGQKCSTTAPLFLRTRGETIGPSLVTFEHIYWFVAGLTSENS